MWWAGSRQAGHARASADVYLGRRRAAMRVEGGESFLHEGGAVTESVGWLAAGLTAQAADRVPGGIRIASIRVRLGASLCRPVLLEPIVGDLSPADRVRAAKAMAVARAGLASPCSVWLDREDDGGRRMAVVVEQAVLDGLEAAAAKHRVRLESVRPWWSEALDDALAARPGLQAMAAWEDDVLTLLAGADTSISLARALTSIHDATTARAAFLRMCMVEGIDPACSIAVALDLDATAEMRGPLGFGRVVLA